MNFDHFAIWLKCFWAVICPDWWTLVLLVAAAAAFGIMKLVYARQRIKDKNAMQQVGRRWRLVGWIMLAAAVTVYIVEVLVVNLVYSKVISNAEKPSDTELIRALRCTEMQYARMQTENEDLPAAKRKSREKVKNDFKPTVDKLTLAEKKQLDLAHDFSRYLAKTPLRRFYPAPKYTPSREEKKETVQLLEKQFNLSASDPRTKQLRKTAAEEFIEPELKGALKKLKSDLIAKLEKITFTGYFLKEAPNNWDSFGVTNENCDFPGLVKALDQDISIELIKALNEKIDPDNPRSDKYSDYLTDTLIYNLQEKLSREIRAIHNIENFNELAPKVVAELKKDPKFESMTPEDQLSAFNGKFRNALDEMWRKRVNEVVPPELSEWNYEAMFYNNDERACTKLNGEEKALNGRLRALYLAAPWMHDLVWCVVIALVALCVFTLRGNKIIRQGNPRTVRNKIHQA